MAGPTETIDQAGGSAATQGDLWGERARDWAEVLEGWNGWGIPLYRHILERITVERGTRVLDVGCGAGRFCRIAADRGAQISGLDATATFIQIARERVSAGDFRPIVRAIRALGEEPVRDALTEGVRPLRTASGGVRFEDEYRYLIASS